MKTPTISLPRKMELLFLNVSGTNISWLSITSWMQMCYLLNLIYFIMGLNNASLFHNEQSNMWFWKKRSNCTDFSFTSTPPCILTLKWTNLLGNLKSPQFLEERWGNGLLRPWGFSRNELFCRMFLTNFSEPGSRCATDLMRSPHLVVLGQGASLQLNRAMLGAHGRRWTARGSQGPGRLRAICPEPVGRGRVQGGLRGWVWACKTCDLGQLGSSLTLSFLLCKMEPILLLLSRGCREDWMRQWM